jgi:REP element-mobilizing transposase RayT
LPAASFTATAHASARFGDSCGDTREDVSLRINVLDRGREDDQVRLVVNFPQNVPVSASMNTLQCASNRRLRLMQPEITRRGRWWALGHPSWFAASRDRNSELSRNRCSAQREPVRDSTVGPPVRQSSHERWAVRLGLERRRDAIPPPAPASRLRNRLPQSPAPGPLPSCARLR